MSDADELSYPADTMRERIGESELKLRFLVTANRWLVSAVFMASIVVTMLALDLLGVSSVQKLGATNAVGSLFSSIVIAVITGVTLVLTVSQVVLSEEVGPLGEKYGNMESSVEFRRDVESMVGADVVSPEPAPFLQTLVSAVGDRARALSASVDEDSAAGSSLSDYAAALVEHGEQVGRRLETAEFGTFQVLVAILDYNYSWKIYAGRTLRAEHGDALSASQREALDDLLDLLEFFGPARAYFKTLYFQWEIIDLSRAVLYISLPSVGLAAYMIVLFDPAAVTGSTLGFANRFLVVTLAFTATMAPFAILVSYVLRIITVSKRTLAIGPFVLRETQMSGGSDGN